MSKTKKEPKTESALISSFEEACAKEGLNPLACLPDVSKSPDIDKPAIIGNAKLLIITRALNRHPDGSLYEADWNDGDEYKYYPFFDMEVDDNNPSGFRFGASTYGWSDADSAGGSRLCFRTRALSDYAGKTFEGLYRDIMVVPKK